MSFLIFVQRKQDILRRKNEINMKLMNLREKLFSLQSYASSIADNSVSMNDLMTVPPSLFNRMSIFANYSHQSALASANEKYATLSQIPGSIPAMETPELQTQYAQMMFKNLYDQGRESFTAVEKEILNKQDLKIEKQVAEYETQLKMLEAEETEVDSASDAGAKKTAPKFVA